MMKTVHTLPLQNRPAAAFVQEIRPIAISKFIARQSANPYGLFGRLLFGRLLNRANASSNQLVYDSLQHNAQSRVLEVGFGGGNLLFRIANSLAGGHVEGIDVSAEMLANAQAKVRKMGLDGTVGLQQGSVDSLPFPDASFDCACSVHTIYFWSDLNIGLRELARVIRPGGRLVLGFSSDSALISEGYTERGFKAYSLQQLTDACVTWGFTAEELVTTERKHSGEVLVYRGIRHSD